MPQQRPEQTLEQRPRHTPGQSDVRGAGREGGLGRRTTLAVACVLAVLGGPVTAGGTAYAAQPATQPATQPVLQPTAQPTPQPSPGVAPEPQPEPGPAPGSGPAPDEPDPRGDAAGSGGGRGDGGAGRAGDDHWSTALPDPASGGGASDDGASEEGVSDDGAPEEASVDGETSLEDVRKQIESLHDRAGSATDAYNAAEAQAQAQREKIADLERRVESTRKKLGKLKKRAGALARAQYRSGGLPAAAQLLLSEDPEAFLRDAGLADRGRQAAKGVVTSLTKTKERLDRYTRDARKRYADLEDDRDRKAAARKHIEKQLKKAEKLESRLAEDERERLRELERQSAYARQLRWLRTGVLAEIDGKATEQGRKAVAYATAQIGKDYEWGAEGPTTYDCSGLTMRAWEAAGRSIPRTSQEQWRQLPRVDVDAMRPGDLIIYKDDASHVGMYLGDGVMVHAPRTGRQITVQGAGSYPILGVVRPDK